MSKMYQMRIMTKMSFIVVVFFEWIFTFILFQKVGFNIFWVSFVLFTTFIAIDVITNRIYLNDRGISRNSFFSREQFLRWEDIEAVKYTTVKLMPIYILVPIKGKKIYLSGYKKLGEILLKVIEFTPHAKLDPEVLIKLEKLQRYQ
ncbi:MAG: hypothetical protein KAX49_20970 [Halanaerobiales bacterium]|nr:hypothetical protein [Halanaerobiales bacterium]